MNVIAKICFLVVFVTATLRSATFAQASSPDTKGCADTPDGANQTLSDKLSQTNGVVCPPNVDPGIKAPTPNSGTMPVIPPPGSPGGDPSVQPK